MICWAALRWSSMLVALAVNVDIRSYKHYFSPRIPSREHDSVLGESRFSAQAFGLMNRRSPLATCRSWASELDSVALERPDQARPARRQRGPTQPRVPHARRTCCCAQNPPARGRRLEQSLRLICQIQDAPRLWPWMTPALEKWPPQKTIDRRAPRACRRQGSARDFSAGCAVVHVPGAAGYGSFRPGSGAGAPPCRR